MAEITRKLNKLGLTQVWNKVVELFASKEEVEELSAVVQNKAEAATSLSGYGITDAYTKEETDNAISEAVTDVVGNVQNIYTIKGSVAFEDLPTEDVTPGWVYNIIDDFVTTDAFVEGAGGEYSAGTNVVYTEDGWDCMAGTYDFSEYVKAEDLVDITEEEINEICVLPAEVG